jgi:hypothetical protein
MSAKPSPGPLLAALIGAAVGSALFVALAPLMMNVGTYDEEGYRYYELLPALWFGVAGGAVGCALWAVLTRRRVPAALLVLSWCLLGGLAGYLLAHPPWRCGRPG